MRAAPLLVVMMGFASAAGAQDATGLGALPKAQASVTRAKAMSLPATYAFGARSVQAPLIAPADSNPDAPHPLEARNVGPRAGCEGSANDLCYDASDNHIVYRPARRLMPTIAGLTPENISVRRNGVRLKYSFP